MPDTQHPKDPAEPRKARPTRSSTSDRSRTSTSRASSARTSTSRKSTPRTSNPRKTTSRTDSPRTSKARTTGTRAASPRTGRSTPSAPPAPATRPRPTSPPKQPNTGSRAPVTSAGYALAVGLLCFALWILFDARQLFNSANASPLGARRSTAMVLLRPIMRFEDVFGLDRFVDGGNRALGRHGTPTLAHPGGSSSSTTTTIPATTTTTTPPTIVAAIPPVPPHITEFSPNLRHVPVSPARVSPPPPSASGPPLLVQPTPARPLVILDVGDSIGEDLGYGLDNVVGESPRVRLVLAAQESTGLADQAYYNWPAHLEADIQRYHPRLVIVMLGANDWNGLLQNNVGYAAGSAQWRHIYAQRVAQMMSEATSAGARVMWVGMPIMEDPVLSADMEVLNAIFEQQAARHPGVVYVPTWRLFSTPSGHYLTYASSSQGLVQVRAADGVHIALPAGGEYVGTYVVEQIERHFHIRI